MARDLRDKVIVITGASSGIGAATALACAAAGMRVVGAARRVDRLKQVVGQIVGDGGRALAVECDVTRSQDVRRLIERTETEFGRLDVLFANAGYGFFATLMETTELQLRAIFETNFFGTVRCIREAVPAIRRTLHDRPGEHGHILVCSSAVSEIAMPRYGAYCATKAAQDSIAGALRAELEGERIDVASVHPVTTRTEFFEQAGRASGGLPRWVSTDGFFVQSAEKVAKAVVRCLRRPKPEVWPQPLTRYGLAMCTAFPRLAATAGRWKMRHP